MIATKKAGTSRKRPSQNNVNSNESIPQVVKPETATLAVNTATAINPLDHQGLVRAIAKLHRGRGLEWDDLVSAGQVGLMIAVHRFDPSKGYQFSTYATPWVHRTIARALQLRLVRVPEYLHWDGPGQERCRAAAKRIFAAQREDGLERLMSRGRPVEIDVENREAVELLLRSLTKREVLVLSHYYGLDGRRALTFAQLAQRLGEHKKTLNTVCLRALERLVVATKKNPQYADSPACRCHRCGLGLSAKTAIPRGIGYICAACFLRPNVMVRAAMREREQRQGNAA